MTPLPEDFDAAVRQHDAQLAAAGLTVWVGSEPTFTDRSAQSPEWLSQALGGDKELRALAVTAALVRRFPGGLMMRTVGRQYPGEALPRWNLGLLRRRDGAALWLGPPDPLLTPPVGEDAPALQAWIQALADAFEAQPGWVVSRLPTLGEQHRLLLRVDTAVAEPADDDARLARPSVHEVATPASGLRDELAEAGLYLFTLSRAGQAARLELPLLPDVPMFLAVLQALVRACRTCALPSLILAGYPPPCDATVEFTTVTPDPAVVEINTAPSLDAQDFLQRSRQIYAAADDAGLASYRLYFNGAVADSGGGGQITLGGPSPLTSPFIQQPLLLPRLVAFFNRHPSLSYFFSHDHVGSSGQSARADERGPEMLDELSLALALLQRKPDTPPEQLWHSLAPFLCDAAGNSHRAEINIEKLWNPYLAHRGQLGLVEFRALRMQHTPERATALACLLRALVAMLASKPLPLTVVDWGRELHERFALPFYLEQDLRAVLTQLDAAGFGLGEALGAVLLGEEFRLWGQLGLPGGRLEVRRALEFWPLLGDAASPEQGGGSRLIDASTARVELRLLPDARSADDGRGWQISVQGVPLPMRQEQTEAGPAAVYSLRYRSFVPTWGLHPALASQAPVQLRLHHPGQAQDRLVTLHEWHPEGEAYDGLPQDLAEAKHRRAERLTVQLLPAQAAPATALDPARPATAGLRSYCLDLRCLT